MKKYKRLISGAIAAVMAMGGAGAFGAFADNTDGAALFSESTNVELPPITEDEVIASGSCGDDLTWRLRESGTLTISGTGAMNDYLSTMANPIEAPWFGYKDKINTVIIGQGVTYIGKYAFENCTAIEKVTVNDSVTSIGEGCFCDCSALKEVPVMNGVALISRNAFKRCNSLTSVTIPDSVDTLDTNAFAECKALKSVKIGSVATVGAGAFAGCTALSSVEISSGVNKFYNSAFYNCPSLKSVTIPAEVTSIGIFAFGYVSKNDGSAAGMLLEGFTIYGFRNSIADSYAAGNHITFKALDEMGSGDIDGSGTTDLEDLVIMQKIAAGWKTDSCDMEAADVDGDGDTDVDDLILLQKAVAGWNVQLGVKSSQ